MTAGQPRSVAGWDCHRLGTALIFFLPVAGLCILSQPDIWEAPNEPYIIAT